MSCPSVSTGRDFLAGALAHIDCQAQTIGSYGFAALASPSSPVSLALTSLLTIFIALFGIRLLLGYPMGTRDVVGDLLKVGIVLTLATSWPAWRAMGYDLIIHGPDQIAHVVGSSAGLPGGGGDLAARLQNVDKGLAAFNVFGSGRLGVAQGDWFQLGFARIAFLTGTLMPIALVRLLAGFLLAIAPLMAGLLLFGITRGIFEGWARALVMTFLGSVMLSLVYGVELALIEPWLQDALQRRTNSMQTLDAPVEILVATLGFAVVSLAALFLVAKMAFHGPLHLPVSLRSADGKLGASSLQPRAVGGREVDQPHRAAMVASSVTENLRREERIADITRMESGRARRFDPTPSVLSAQTSAQGHGEALGSTWRRPSRRGSGAAQRRDRK
jgi:type IV secretion system protein VirB6